MHGVSPDRSSAGNGSDDLLTILTRAFVGPGDVVVYPTPSYILYRTLAELQDARPVEVPFGADWTLDPAEFAHARGEARVPGQPEQPVGHRTRPPTRSPRCAGRSPCPLVVDEAYADFAETRLRRARRRPPQRDRHADPQQGLEPGRPPPRLPDRPARDRRRAGQGEGFVQLRHPQPRSAVGRRSRTRPTWPRPGEDPRDPHGDSTAALRALGLSRPREPGQFRLVRGRAAPRPRSTRPSRRGRSSSA